MATVAAETIDPARTEAFLGKVVGDTGGFFITLLAAIGDKYGLFKDLASNGPATSEELAARTGIDERYAREWLGAMTSAGYLAYEPASGTFALPPEHAPVLADESGPAFFGGVHYELLGLTDVVPRVVEAFREGGGAHHSTYRPEWWEGMERFTAAWFENLLLQQWIPAVPEVERKLREGADVADVGSGAGRALIKLAEAFPASRYVGYDISPAQVERAEANARAAAVGDRVRFEVRDAARGLPGTYDIVTTFDVVHDAGDPLALLRAIRDSLDADGVYLCLDWNTSDRLEENAGPMGTLLHGFSVFYCLTTSLAEHGTGLGTLGLTETKLRDLATEAGFSAVSRLELENPFNNLYEVRP